MNKIHLIDNCRPYNTFIGIFRLRLSLSRVGVVVSVSAPHTLGRGFASRLGKTEDQYQNGTHYLPALLACGRI